MLCAVSSGQIWQSTLPAERAAVLDRAADQMEGETQQLMGLLVREVGQDLCQRHCRSARGGGFSALLRGAGSHHFSNDSHRPLGPVVCISPWNFPLAIFSGQVAAALAAGNTVLAKPAEQTPLIAAQAVRYPAGGRRAGRCRAAAAGPW